MTEREIFTAALSKANPAERAAFLDDACAGDAALRQRVESLLAEHEQLGSFMEVSSPEATLDRQPSQRPGTMIGPYKLLQQIGEGGMGVVYMAEQTQPVERKVALKIIKPGMDTRQVIARFEAERQALAMMDHPNIAKVLDAGTTQEVGGRESGVGDEYGQPTATPDSRLLTPGAGRPYFIMELVKGVPITHFCDERRLSLRERLALVVPVCQAIQHAHQKGIIHRDIKPTNILVTLYDGRPVPKVIDFGVAKAMGPKLTEKTMFTALGQLVGTLEYMSPEQAQLNQLDIDTRSDIYSLGVVLYELLTGSTPLDQSRLRTQAFDETLRIIREEEPLRPSTRLSSSQSLPTIAANRGSEPGRLQKAVRGELDWIVMRCLEKDRNRRYETAGAFAMDVQRYLRDEPVEACPPAVGYRLRKFIRRHGHLLLSAAAFAILLMAAVVLLAIQNGRLQAQQRRTLQEQARAEAHFQKTVNVVDQMVSQVGLNLSFYPYMSGQRRNLLEKALALHLEFVHERGDDPQVRRRAAEACHRVADVYRELGQTDLARQHYEEAISRMRDVLEESPNDRVSKRRLAGTLLTFGGVLLKEHQYAAARTVLEEALARCEQLLAESPQEAECHSDLAAALNNFAVLLEGEGGTPDAIPLVERAIEHQRMGLRGNPKSWENREFLGNHYHSLSRMLRVQGKLQQALEACLEAKAIREELASELPLAPGNRKALAGSWDELADLHFLSGNRTEAVQAVQKSYEFSRQLTRDFPAIPEFIHTHALSCAKLGALLDMAGRKADALALYQQGVKVAEPLAAAYPKQAENQSLLGGALNNVARIRVDQNELTEARALYERAVGHQTIALQLDPKSEIAREYLGNHYHGLADTLTRLADHVEAAKAAAQLADLDRPRPPKRLAIVKRAAYADRFWAAQYLSRCAALAEKDSTLAADERAALVEDYSRQAVERLRQAVDRGYEGIERLQRAPEFDPLRSREDFQKLVGDLEARQTGSAPPATANEASLPAETIPPTSPE